MKNDLIYLEFPLLEIWRLIITQKIIDQINQSISQLGYQSVLHRIAIITAEGYPPRIHSVIFRLLYEKPSSQYEKIYGFGGIEIFESKLSLKKFDGVLKKLMLCDVNRLSRLGLHGDISKGKDLPKKLQMKIGTKIVNVVGTFQKGQIYGTKEKFSHIKRDSKTPLWVFRFQMAQPYSAMAWPEVDFTKSRPPYENPQDCINEQLGLDFFIEQNSPFFGIILPITKARIESCDIFDKKVRVKLNFSKDFHPKKLFLNLICEYGNKKERPTQDINTDISEIEINTKFTPERVTVHLIDDDLKIDSLQKGELVKNSEMQIGAPFTEHNENTINQDTANKLDEQHATIFISHAMDDYELAKQIKEVLEFLELSVFIAHQDIAPSEKWEEFIFHKIEACPIFVPLITESFKRSEWTDQETGIALASRSKIIPIIIDMDPYGFMKKIQGLRWSRNFFVDISALASQIIDQLPSEARERIRHSIIENFANWNKCNSYDIAGTFARIILNFQNLTSEEVEKVAKAIIKNDQVYNSKSAKRTLQEFFHKYKGKLPNEYHDDEILKSYVL